MLLGFEEITKDLNDYEKYTLVPVMLRGLSSKLGKEKAVTANKIVQSLKGHFKLNDVRVRKIVNHIRKCNLLPGLVASSKGYYLSQDPVDLIRYAKSVQGRINEERMVVKYILDYAKQLSDKQQSYLSFTEADL